MGEMGVPAIGSVLTRAPATNEGNTDEQRSTPIQWIRGRMVETGVVRPGRGGWDIHITKGTGYHKGSSKGQESGAGREIGKAGELIHGARATEARGIGTPPIT